jgi:hypothetical protein
MLKAYIKFGLDIWLPYLKKFNSLSVYDLLILAALPDIPLKQKSVSISLACVVLEHVYKKMVICSSKLTLATG